ncbi:hypothetical protein [Alkalicoccobacillus plakortidis]|uniref:Uncharacterized protein n=1 Tax=Alkalicoccobacillus plakortidis TaxID=444060 RepID=A0ABT0XFQ1_9BACI|nr:hypothetical protein [Alkalicoccobacillus plakortidis]MCM2674054.1 hypothetical protein [Alkalicoccobacillus plakortidis]MCM2677733.1 hypothetical protein [Alkalicoccobacillus plakortidis]
MKQRLQLNIKGQQMIIEAMEDIRPKRYSAEQKRFDLILNKVVEGKKDFDSEEMIYITQSLRKHSKFLSLCREEENCLSFRKLADRVERARIAHQDKHHPLKKALTAVTVSASVLT